MNAELLEDAVRQMLAAALPKLGYHLTDDELTPDQMRHRLDQHATKLAGMKSPLKFAAAIQLLAPKIVMEKGRIQIHLTPDKVSKLIVQPVDESPQHSRQLSFPVKIDLGADDIVISATVELTCRRGRAEIVDGQTGKVATSGRTEPKTSLIQTLVQAEYWRTELLKNPAISLHDLLKTRDLQPGYIRRLLDAAYLAPAITQGIFQGTQPTELQVQNLLKPRSMDWNIQMREMGFVEGETSACR